MPEPAVKPVAKASIENGATTLVNSESSVSGAVAGTPAWACTNNGLVAGPGAGAGAGWSTVVGAVDSSPRLTAAPSSAALVPSGGFSRLPALSAANAGTW